MRGIRTTRRISTSSKAPTGLTSTSRSSGELPSGGAYRNATRSPVVIEAGSPLSSSTQNNVPPTPTRLALAALLIAERFPSDSEKQVSRPPSELSVHLDER